MVFKIRGMGFRMEFGDPFKIISLCSNDIKRAKCKMVFLLSLIKARRGHSQNTLAIKGVGDWGSAKYKLM